ncbi:RAD50-interacting protein 1 [Apiospora arundinis]
MMEPDTRLEDYLDDKLQSVTDLENLDSLLASVEQQRVQLQTQLDGATQELEDVRRSAQDRQGGLAKQIEDFEQLQHSIDLRLQIMGQSDAPDEAIRRLEAPMKQLHKVELAHRYVSMLQDVETMRREARSHLPQSPKAALEPYARLRQLAGQLRELQGPADEAAGHLVAYVEQVTASLWDEMKKIMSEELGTVLKARNWPTDTDPESQVDAEWLATFEMAMDLQVPEVLSSESLVNLLPVEVMAGNFLQWFRFQFMGDKPTSAPAAFGTLFLPNFVKLIDRWGDFFRSNFAHVLASRFQGTKAAETMAYADPACALITALLPVLRQKLESVVQHGLKNPQFFSSLMVQLMDFDDTIRSRFFYDGGDPENGWSGITSEVLDQHFREWLKFEKEYALERYQTVITSADARKIDYDYSTPGKMKPTYGAVRVTDLLRSVTSQYERVRRLPHKIRFLIDIQQEILDQYHNRLLDSLEAYAALTSTVARTLQGVSKEQLAALEGTGAFEVLCEVLVSADHIVWTLKDWDNEEFFIELWEDLKSRAKQTDDDQTNLVGGMSYDHVKDRTSSQIGSEADGSIFDETIKSYSKRRETAQRFLQEALVESHRTVFRPYLSTPQWSIVSNEASVDPTQLAVTAELDEPLRIMKRNLTFLASALSTATYKRIWRGALESLQESLWSSVLMRQNFTTLGAAQFMRDVQAILALVDRHIPHGSAAMAQLEEGVRLLSLPPVVHSREENSNGDGDEEGNDKSNSNNDTRFSLKQISDRMFTDNTEARSALEDLGIQTLEPANARRILQRRVENSE